MLQPCEHCGRHVLAESACPFCKKPAGVGLTTAAFLLGLSACTTFGGKSDPTGENTCVDYGCSYSDTDTDSDVDSDTDADSDADSDADTDSDTDSDTDTDTSDTGL